jgi:hypothetical protein
MKKNKKGDWKTDKWFSLTLKIKRFSDERELGFSDTVCGWISHVFMEEIEQAELRGYTKAIKEIRKWVKENNKCSDLFYTSALLDFLSKKEGEK